MHTFIFISFQFQERRNVAFLILLTVLLCVSVIEDKPLPDAIKNKGEAEDNNSLLSNITHQLFKVGNSSGEVSVKRKRVEANAKQTIHDMTGSIVQVEAGKLVFKGDIQSAIPSELDIKRENVTGPNKTISDNAVGVAVMEQDGHSNTYTVKNASAYDRTIINIQPNNTSIPKENKSTDFKPITNVLHNKSDKTYASAHSFQQNESQEKSNYTSSIDSKIKNASKKSVSPSGLIVVNESKLNVRSLKDNISKHNETVTFDAPTLLSSTTKAVIEDHTTNSTTKVTKQTTVINMTTVTMKPSTTTPRYENNSLGTPVNSHAKNYVSALIFLLFGIHFYR